MRSVAGKLALAAPGLLAFLFLLGPALKFDASLLDPELVVPFARSAAIGFLSAVLSGVLGVALGWILMSRRYRPGTAAWLIAPFCLGSAAWGVLFYPVVHLLPGIEDRSTLSVYSVLIAINVMQYAPLIGFISYHSFSQVTDNSDHVRSALQLNSREAIRLIYWPGCRSVLLFTCVIVYCAAASESDRALIYFDPSPGTGTQLFPHALGSLYQRLNSLGIGPEAVISNAMIGILASAALIVGLVLGSEHLLRLVLLGTAGAFGMSHPHAENSAVARDGQRRWPLITFAAVLLGSFLWSRSVGDGLVANALIFVSLAALIISAAYIAYSCLIRIYCGDFWKSPSSPRMRAKGLRAIIRKPQPRTTFISTLVAVRIIPSIVIYYIVLLNAVSLERSSDAVRGSVWILAHLVYNAAIILPFLMILMESVAKQELDFLKSSGMKMRNLIHLSFLSRFRRDLVLTFVFSFVLVWNGDAINQALSSTFTSANSKVVDMLIGRNHDVPRVIELVIPAVISAVLAVLLVARSSVTMLERRRGAGPRGSRAVTSARQRAVG